MIFQVSQPDDNQLKIVFCKQLKSAHFSQYNFQYILPNLYVCCTAHVNEFVLLSSRFQLHNLDNVRMKHRVHYHR
jgi:hypothetical protein